MIESKATDRIQACYELSVSQMYQYVNCFPLYVITGESQWKSVLNYISYKNKVLSEPSPSCAAKKRSKAFGV